MPSETNTAEGKISLNDVRARILRVPAKLRKSLPPGTEALHVSYGEAPPVKCSLGSDGIWVSGVTLLFRDVGVLRGGTSSPEARIATASWTYHPSDPEVTLTVHPQGGWVSVGKESTPADEDSPAQSLDATWTAYLEEARADPSWVEDLSVVRSDRATAATEMLSLLDEFARGLPLDEFASRFDRSSRREWEAFHLSGFSFAMFANTLAKHLGADAELPGVLRDALVVPSDKGEAVERLGALTSLLAARAEAGTISGRDVSPGYAPSFLSCWWHLEDPSQWAINYGVVRTALLRFGGLESPPDRIDGYIAFNRRFFELAQVLGVDASEFEHLCRRLADESDVGTQSAGDEADSEPAVWLVQPGEQARLWEQCRDNNEIVIGWDDLGDLREYTSRPAVVEALQKVLGTTKKKVNDAAACHDFAYEMKVGDFVVAKKGITQVLAWGRVSSDYRYEPNRDEYHHVRGVEWLKLGPWDLANTKLVVKTVTEISNYPVLMQTLRELLGLDVTGASESLDEDVQPSAPKVSISDAASQVFMAPGDLETALGLLVRKKNVILKGAPGTGKTFLARWLSFLLMGEKDTARVTTVQFHQSYAYEDFVQGYRPAKDGGWVLKNGPFIELCKRAEADQERPYVLIIDEINRGNISRILGELLMLLEGDKRSNTWATALAYSDGNTRFFVPPNVHVIGTMNTADRSLAVVDYALRRRFAFVDVDPGFDSDGFRDLLQTRGVDDALIKHIQKCLGALNETIAKDHGLGPGFRVGHSYFCDPPKSKEDWYSEVIKYEILPLLDEYWFDDVNKVSAAAKVLSEPPS